MKLFFASLLLLSSVVVNAAEQNLKCIEQAKAEAALYAAGGDENQVGSFAVTGSFFHSETDGVLYYGILVNDETEINVGLDNITCELRHINVVTDVTE